MPLVGLTLADLRPYANLLLLFLPLLIQHGRRLLHSLTQPRTHPRPPPLPPRTRQLWSALLLLHTLQQLLALTLLRPPNIFTTLHAPLSAPVSSLQTILRLAPGALSPHIATPQILRALQSLPVREAYVRFGHPSVAGCDYCTRLPEYELFSLSGRVVSYAVEAGWVMFLSAGWTRRQEWRPLLLSLLAGMVVGESWVLRTVEVDLDEGGTFMWHDNLHLLRHALFLLLSLSLPLLPAAPPPPPIPMLHIIPQLHLLAQRLNFLRLQRSAIPHSPALRGALVREWEKESKARGYAFADHGLRHRARELGLDIEEDGPAQRTAEAAVGRAWELAGLPKLYDEEGEGEVGDDEESTPPIVVRNVNGMRQRRGR